VTAWRWFLVPFGHRHWLLGHPFPPGNAAFLAVGLPTTLHEDDRTLSGFPRSAPARSTGVGASCTPGTVVSTRSTYGHRPALSSVAADIMGVSGRLMLQALIDQQGAADPAAIADLAKRRMRSKIPDLTEALTGHFTAHHAFMTRMFLDRIDAQSKDIAVLSERIENLMEPFLPARELLESIPGVSQIVAEIVIAETGADMTQFPTPEQLASWAGVSPGAHESAGKVKSSKTRPGNRYLKGALGVAALTALRSTTHTYFAAKYRRLAPTRGPMKALVAVEHSMLTAAWHMLQNGDFYRDLGADYYTRREPSKAKARAIKQLEALGYQVTIEPQQQAS